MIRDSVTIMRYFRAAFCSITTHQGRIIVALGGSVLRE
jgi:hypothetical protein